MATAGTRPGAKPKKAGARSASDAACPLDLSRNQSISAVEPDLAASPGHELSLLRAVHGVSCGTHGGSDTRLDALTSVLHGNNLGLTYCDHHPGVRGHHRHLRLLVLVAVTAVSVVALPPVAHAAADVDRGVVQRVAEGRLVLRALDGSVVTVAVGRRTRVFLNGTRAPLRSVEPGFVAVVTRAQNGPARTVRAFGRVRLVVEGIVVSVSRSRLELRVRGGGFESVALTGATRVRQGAVAVSLSAVRVGRPARVLRRANGSARLVVLRPPAGDRER